jgi:uncharacterized protein
MRDYEKTTPAGSNPFVLHGRPLRPPRRMKGTERRRIDPNKGLLKLLERNIDRVVSRFVFPHLFGLWHPYTWLLPRRFSLAEITLAPEGWPRDIGRLRVLLLSDIHTGTFLKPGVLSEIIGSLMKLKPDLVAIAGDAVTAQASDLDGFLPALMPLSAAPLGAWYCPGNHDYFSDDFEGIRRRFDSIGIRTLKNDVVALAHGGGTFMMGGLDDLILGTPDWERMMSVYGRVHLLLAHNPDFFYEAARRAVPLTLSGHTHGGQIRFRNGPPLVRQSRFCLDEGAYSFGSSLLVVSRGLGSVGLPWRYGADPEAVLIEVQ